jgi:putative SOS response-associated peptidase YedK
MCGRFALYSSGEQIAEDFDLADTPIIVPHYIVTPTQTVPVVRVAEGGRELALLEWGLLWHNVRLGMWLRIYNGVVRSVSGGGR